MAHSKAMAANALGHLLFWPVFGFGHYWSRLIIIPFSFMGWTYPVYNNAMLLSVRISDTFDVGQWSQPK